SDLRVALLGLGVSGSCAARSLVLRHAQA
ncbi:hypothetical protein A2U01_0047463, partial [Trifolium medium]|nr:hypothetical protein [Trifolium medium]